MKVRKLHVYLTLVCLCAGFLISYSYQYTQEQEYRAVDFAEWFQEDLLRDRLNEARMENHQLEQHLRDLQQNIAEKEASMALIQNEASDLQKELEMLRMYIGLTEVTGQGISMTLDDHHFASEAGNPNDFIVHEQDVRRVVNELFAAGAEGISINGQRVIHSTSIRCVGPTIIVNGVRSTAPFHIEAIGDANTLYNSLLLPGGVVDLLKSWDIHVKLERSQEVVLPAFIGEL
jgi:uncharacterized protein YlxW (UPF0749 family)